MGAKIVNDSGYGPSHNYNPSPCELFYDWYSGYYFTDKLRLSVLEVAQTNHRLVGYGGCSETIWMRLYNQGLLQHPQGSRNQYPTKL